MGEFIGTLLLTSFYSQLLVFVNENLIMTAFCTGLIRYLTMKIFADCCGGEFNPGKLLISNWDRPYFLAITIGRVFCLKKGFLISFVLIVGQIFGAFIGEILFTTIRPATAQAFPFDVYNESEAFVDRLPNSFQSVSK